MRARRVLVRVGSHAVGGHGDLLETVGLGSCVAIVLHDPRVGVGGMAHVLLPEPARSGDVANPFKFASTAVPQLLQLLAEAGAARRRIEGRLVGGAGMFSGISAPSSLNVGERNLSAAREALGRARIPIRGEEVGGDWGRSVYFDAQTGAVRVTSVFRSDVLL